ncbi:hypothetical protein MYCTH_2067028, partial [Thermothelomyces thermophilus ATCC 42464]
VGLILDLKKYIFTIKEVKYLNYIIEVYLDPKKLAAICNFLGFVNFYRDFIFNFSKLTIPLI